MSLIDMVLKVLISSKCLFTESTRKMRFPMDNIVMLPYLLLGITSVLTTFTLIQGDFYILLYGFWGPFFCLLFSINLNLVISIIIY